MSRDFVLKVIKKSTGSSTAGVYRISFVLSRILPRIKQFTILLHVEFSMSFLKEKVSM